MLQGIEYKHFEQLLIRDPDLHRLVRRAVLLVPGLDKGDVYGPSGMVSSKIKRAGSPQEGYPISSIIGIKRSVCQKWLDIVR